MMEITGAAITEQLIKIKIAVIIAKLTDIKLDIEEIENLIERENENEKNSKYSIYRKCLDRLC
jgi:hypothetical protein